MRPALFPYEPWFRAWLILLPMVIYGSHYIIFNARLRMAQLAKDSMEVSDPEGTWGYAAVCGLAFSLLMVIISRLWVKSTLPAD
mgnify:FL=1|jgi:hypothetical protein